MATLQNIGALKYRGKDGQWHPLPVVVQDAGGGVSTISGKGAPTSATQGKVNQLYRDEDTQRLYICTAADGGYTWAAVSGGGGLSSTEKNLMLTLFKNMLSKVDISGTVSQLETLWTSGGGGTQEYCQIKYNLTNVASSSSQTQIANGQSYTTTLTANENYTISTVTVLMGGVEITNTAYADGTVTIASVTGDVVISAIAEQSGTGQSWQDGVAYTLEWIEGEYVEKRDGTIKQYAGWDRTGYMNCYKAASIEIDGNNYSSGYNAFYDENKNFISSFAISVGNDKMVDVPANAVYFIISTVSDQHEKLTITPHA